MKTFEKTMFALVITVMVIIMFYWIAQKEGFHEDEIFSYGSSNYSLDNLYQRFGEKDELNQILFDEVLTGTLNEKLNKIMHYVHNPNAFMEKYDKLVRDKKPIWKTSEKAKEYLTIQKEDVLNFFSVYYNQSRDVHSPLFYILVHIFSCVFLGLFSKYIIFLINIIFFALSCIVLRKILKILNKEYLSIPVVILYGLSIGSISAVIFLRMYQMLTFFVLESIYIQLQIIKNNLVIDKKIRNKLIIVTILGFLTQYYYCIFALFEFLVLSVIFVKNKNIIAFKKYFKYHIIAALSGIMLFPASIYHIFFSYRGIGSGVECNYGERITAYFNELSYAFSIPLAVLILFIIVIIGIYFYNLLKKDNENKKMYISILNLPVAFYFVLVSLISPQMDNNTIIRYIFCTIPLLSIIVILACDEFMNKIKNNQIVTVALLIPVLGLSTYGMLSSTPRFLYKGYNKVLEVANENKEAKFIYICDNGFIHLEAMPEFLVYKNSLIININFDSLEILKQMDEIKNEYKFILSIQKLLNHKEILKQVMEITGFTEYNIILDSNELQTIIYEVDRGTGDFK